MQQSIQGTSSRVSHVGRRLAQASATGVLVLILLGMAVLSWVLPSVGLQADGAAFWPVLLVGVGMGVVIAAASGVLIYQLVRRVVVRRLDALIQAFRVAEEGDLLHRMHAASPDEFGEVGRAFNALMDRIAELTASALQSDLMIRWAQRELRLKEDLLAKSRQLADLNTELVRRVDEASILLKVADAASRSLDLDQTLRALGKVLFEDLDLLDLRALLYDPDTGACTIRHAIGVLEGNRTVPEWRGSAGGAIGACINSGNILYVPNLLDDPRMPELTQGRRIGGSLVVLPFQGHGKVAGAMVLIRMSPDAFLEAERGFLELAARYVGLSVTNSMLHRETVELATRDALTGLNNRRHFMSVLDGAWERAEREDKNLSMLMIDVDWFKKFNDVHGHLVGDEVLRKVARVTLANLRGTDIVARFGGEEFVVVMPETGLEDASKLAEQLRMAIEATSFVVAHEPDIPMRLTISVGVASRGPDLRGPEDLIRQADRFLYVAKARGRNQVHSAHASSDGHGAALAAAHIDSRIRS
jgi:diguanylate cyclase (GGDEF)-like protein